MSATAPRVSKEAPDMRRVGVAIGALTLAVALVVGGAVARQAGTQAGSGTAQSHKVSAGGYTGIPYTPSIRSNAVSAGGYTGIPYTPSIRSNALSAGGYTGIPYTPSIRSNALSAGGYTGIPYTPSRTPYIPKGLGGPNRR